VPFFAWATASFHSSVAHIFDSEWLFFLHASHREHVQRTCTTRWHEAGRASGRRGCCAWNAGMGRSVKWPSAG